MRARTWAISGAMIGILTLAAWRADGQEAKTSRKEADDNLVTTVGTHVICRGTVTVRVYEQDGKLNFRSNLGGPVRPLIEKGSPWFVYAKSANEIWAFDGHERLFFCEFLPEPNERNEGFGIHEVSLYSDFRKEYVQRMVDKAPRAMRDRLTEAFRSKFLDLPGSTAAQPIKDEPALQNVLATDIPERVQILGKLRQPLGQLVTVRGRWTTPFPSMPARPVLVVNQVNGRPLNPPVEFDDVEPVMGKGGEITKRAVGEEWELRGVETGGYLGFSDEVLGELGQPLMQRPPRGFLTRFCYVRANRVSGSKSIGGENAAAHDPGAKQSK